MAIISIFHGDRVTVPIVFRVKRMILPDLLFTATAVFKYRKDNSILLIEVIDHSTAKEYNPPGAVIKLRGKNPYVGQGKKDA
jgi:hypothetical protein